MITIHQIQSIATSLGSEFVQLYHRPFLWVSLVLGFLVGRFFKRESKLEQLIQGLEQTIKQESGLREKLSSRQKLLSFSRVGFVLCLSLAIGLYYLTGAQIHHDIREVKTKPLAPSLIPLYVLVALFLICVSLVVLMKGLIRSLANQLKNMQTDNAFFLSKLFKFLGEPMKKAMVKAAAGSSDQQIEELQEQVELQNNSISNASRQEANLTKQVEQLREAVQEITSFEWCESCYHPAVSAEEEDAQRKKQKFEQRPRETCKENCLTRFMEISAKITEREA